LEDCIFHHIEDGRIYIGIDDNEGLFEILGLENKYFKCRFEILKEITINNFFRLAVE